MPMIVYGISTCDTCRKAVKALAAAGHDARLQDLRAEPLSQAQISGHLARFGDKLVNRASTTWRSLSEAERERDPVTLLSAHPTLMKRPLIDADGAVFLGFGPDVQAALLG